MKKINEFGRSMVEILGVLAIIGIISGGGVVGYNKGIYKYKLNRTIASVNESIQEFYTFTKRDISGYPTNENKMATSAKKFGLMQDCEIIDSYVYSERDACLSAFGELYPKLVVGEEEYIYSLYVTFVEEFPKVCNDFLDHDWYAVVPEKWLRRGKIFVSSDEGEKTLTISEDGLSLDNVNRACKVCDASEASYCSIILQFKGWVN